MSRRLVSLSLDNLPDVNASCRSCVYWELEPGTRTQACDADPAKQEWIADTLTQWGSCGQILYVDDKPAGHILYAPPAYVPRAAGFPTSPVSSDAVLLMTGQLAAPFRGAGLGKMLIQGMARDIAPRGVRAIEAFGVTNPDGSAHRDAPCLLPAYFLEAVGFRVVRPHADTPRLRLDVRTLLAWKADVESAIDRLLGSIQTRVPAGLHRTGNETG